LRASLFVGVCVRVAACLIAVVEQQAHDDVPREVPELLDHLQHSTHGYSRVLTGTRSAGHRCGQIGPALSTLPPDEQPCC
jgi:hypothetical protein